MTRFRLYCFAQSGNAYKAALMLELCRAEWEPIFVDFFNKATQAPGWRESVNEMGEVPVLLDGELKLTQSGVILDHLAETLGRFGPASPAERREILRWILWDNHKFTSYLATRRFLLQFAGTGDTPVTEFLLGRIRTAFGVLDKHLAGRDWVAADRPTIADLSLAGYIFYDGEIGVSLADWPAIAAWASRIRALPGWRHPYDLMPGHPLPAKA